MNINEKAKKVKEKREQLQEQFPEGYCFLTSQPSDTFNTKGGMVMEVPVYNAATHLVEQTHRLAEAEEIEAFKAEQDRARRAILAQERTKRQSYTVMVDAEGNPVETKRARG